MKVILCPEIESAILGLNWLQDHNATWDMAKHVVVIDGLHVQLLYDVSRDCIRRIVAAETLDILSHDVAFVKTKVMLKDLDDREQSPNLFVDTVRLRNYICLPRTVISKKNRCAVAGV
jgi:hypothetical protein